MDTEKIERVAGHFDATPKCSIRQAAQVLGYKKSSVHNIVKHELKLYPYNISVHHALKETDKTLRVNFAETILDRIALDEDYLSRICFSDEATFHVSGTVHRHNVRIWGKEHPREFQEFTSHSPKINVWCGLTKDRVVGPFFFTEQIVTGQSYLRMLETFAYPVLRNIDNVIFQQDGAPPHWALVVRDSLNENFPNSWIGRDGPTAWPPRSPDVTPLDFFFWGFVKQKVVRESVRDINELKERITGAIQSVTPIMLTNTWRELHRRLNWLADNGGGHVEVYRN